MQIGLVREAVTVRGGELNMATLKDIACAFVDRKVGLLVRVVDTLSDGSDHLWDLPGSTA